MNLGWDTILEDNGAVRRGYLNQDKIKTRKTKQNKKIKLKDRNLIISMTTLYEYNMYFQSNSINQKERLILKLNN